MQDCCILGGIKEASNSVVVFLFHVSDAFREVDDGVRVLEVTGFEFAFEVSVFVGDNESAMFGFRDGILLLHGFLLS